VTAAPAPLATLRGVAKRRQGADRAFELHVGDLTLHPGRSLALVGPSGCGKSTLIDLLALALEPDSAEAFAVADGRGEEVDVAALWRTRRLDRLAGLRARRFGYVLQTGGLLPFLSVGENIALPQRLAGGRDPARVRELAGRLGIADMLGELPGRLSVGQRQRVAIARALAHRPPVVLADEPTASLDPINAAAVFGLFLELVAEEGASLVVATHDREMVAAHAIPAEEADVGRDGTTSVTVFGGHRGEATPPPADRAETLAAAS
jgi:putative ABC transport system ATP-binding protein